ncbi:MAG: clathrin associated protein complex large subunit [Chaenotheca gracillima]|nr:MAG: clathrin associated protein complex large subunit [Chaenotheca gracillima]
MTEDPDVGNVFRRTRIVCVSDTHNTSPLDGAFKLPKGDVLIHAGDLTNQGSFSELQRAVQWIEQADFECKIVIAGNHDITLDERFYQQYGNRFHNQNPQDAKSCRELLTQSKSITYLNHEARDIRLTAPDGPRTCFKVFGSPFSPERGLWAFGYPQERSTALWDEIPLDTDIVLTHTPPQSSCDVGKDRGNAGCEALRHALGRVKPRLAICGHVHEGRGVERVRWADGNGNGVSWIDPGMGNNKMSMVDLTARRGTPLDNDGSFVNISTKDSAQTEDNLDKTDDSSSLVVAPTMSSLTNSVGRKETCIINAAIMASSWPHKGRGGKKLNKPIVVDIDLPVYESLDEI